MGEIVTTVNSMIPLTVETTVNELRWAGKRLTARKVAAEIDKIPHKTYVEPFAGLATVMKYKKPSEREIVSDLDCKIIRVAKKENPALKRAIVMCGKDYKEVMKKYDSPTTLHYLDPPYEGTSCDYKFCELSTKDLMKTVKQMKGTVIISNHPKNRKEICKDKIKCKTIPFKFWGQPRKDLLAIKKAKK